MCDICSPNAIVHAHRDGVSLLLGGAELRVFSNSGVIYAAPDLIFHYVESHGYTPPDEFIVAMREGPRPPSAEYLSQLEYNNIEWCMNPME